MCLLTDAWDTVAGCTGMNLKRSDCAVKCCGENAELSACESGTWEGHIPRFIPWELKRISHLDRYLSSIRLKTRLTPYPWGSHCVPHCLWPRVVSGSQYLLALLFFLPQCCLLYFSELSQNSEWTSSTSGGAASHSDDVLFRETRWQNVTILYFFCTFSG